MTTAPTTSRAALRLVVERSDAYCAGCDRWIKMQSGPGRRSVWQVVCNVYEAGVWDRVEHYHPGCYQTAGMPHGRPVLLKEAT